MPAPQRPVSFYDTSTMPTEEMLDAMRSARLGDDVYGEDPTVNELEALTAAMLGMEASLFLPSGTMANLVAVLAQTRRGDEIAGEADAHLFNYEAGGIAMIAGCMPLLIAGTGGVLTAEQVEPRLRLPNDHYPPTALLAIENTHNRACGAVTPPAVMAARALRPARAPAARRRRPHLQRRRRPGPAGRGRRAGRGLRELLPEQGTQRSGRLDAGGPGGHDP